MKEYERALELNEETIAHRRYLHTNAEVGLDMPKAVEYITNKLTDCGIKAEKCGYGVSATLGKGEKCILLRADMDALPMPEESGEPFACPTGSEAHGCGHDFHAAMLLTAAKMLKERESELCGRVRLMFQPAEETFEGSKNMIENGILDEPKIDAALAFHVTAGKLPIGLYMYNNKSAMMFSVNGFRFTIHGKGAHGAYPQMSIDPINVGVHMHMAFQTLIAREASPEKANVFTIGKFHAGAVNNIIPDSAVLEGTLRCNDPGERKKLIKRIKETAEGVARTFGASVDIEMLSDVPPLICDSQLTAQIAEYMSQMDIPGMQPYPGIEASASEDFAVIAEKVPSCFIYLSAGFTDDRGSYPAHNPKVRFNEEVCPIGAAAYTYCALSWLRDNG